MRPPRSASAKFKRLVRSAMPPTDRADERIARMVDTVMGLDELSDVRQLTAALDVAG